ncbi:MAG: DNA double-strand break repair nuclease NurA [Candidatus Ranarchaeia archaeon]|jgi:hypothetical protein
MDLIKVANQVTAHVRKFMSNKEEWDKHQKELREALPNLAEYLNTPRTPAKKFEDFPINGIHYSINSIFPDVVSMKEWASKVLNGITLIAIDGSQIDFDRHRSPPIALVNVGYVVLVGGKKKKKRTGFTGTVPWVLGSYDLERSEEERQEEWSPTVAYKRWYLETKLSLCLAKVSRQQDPPCDTCEISTGCDIVDLKDKVPFTEKVLLLVDGTLIMSYLREQNEVTKKRYLDLMNEVLEGCKKLSIPIVGVVSYSNAKEIAETLWIASKGGKPSEDVYKGLPSDAYLLMKEINNFGDRTPLLQSNRGILKRYKEKIGFMYTRTDTGPPLRVEIPLYTCSQQSEDPTLQWVWESILAQTAIGRGYPYILARAHEAAVVKASNRTMFYQIVNRIVAKFGGAYFESTKNRRKRHPII